MHILTLYFAACPNYKRATENLRAALRARGLEQKWSMELHQVKSDQEAEKMHFVGSPSFMIDGHDLFGTPPDASYGMRCRIYLLNGRALAVPTVQDFERALDAFR